MRSVSVYSFTNYVDFLRLATATWQSQRQRPLTLDDWADKLGYRSPRSLAMVLNGQRLPSGAMVEKLADELIDEPQERSYFRLLVELARRTRDRATATDVLAEMRRLNPALDRTMPLDAATFSYIADWYHLVLKQLAASPAFRGDVEWLRRRLRGKVTAAEVKQALAVLERLGFLNRDPLTGQLEAVKHGVRTTSDVPSEAIRLHHRQMLARAAEALDEQDVAAREITSATFHMAPERMAEAKEWIRRVRDEFHRKFAEPEAEEIFQFNIQLFAHTQEESTL